MDVLVLQGRSFLLGHFRDYARSFRPQMGQIFNRYGISPTYLSKLRDRALEAIKVAWAGEENDTLDAGRAIDGIVASLGEHLRGEVWHGNLACQIICVWQEHTSPEGLSKSGNP